MIAIFLNSGIHLPACYVSNIWKSHKKSTEKKEKGQFIKPPNELPGGDSDKLPPILVISLQPINILTKDDIRLRLRTSGESHCAREDGWLARGNYYKIRV